ncbi:murein biosynthesis integral membrane protein MurJ [Candidatus Fermentibacteria bacterium]|nr:MAG: murein biosynthesis integral membrane protein MurJ [Candidatus Fermentibacteria bacterium]
MLFAEPGKGNSLGTPAQEGRSIARAAGLLGILTFLSRILGLARDVGQAAVLGTGTAADAFTIAFIIPNILRRLFGEATVSSAFVPTYTETLVKDGDKRASQLAGRILTFTATALLAIVIAGMAAAPILVDIFAGGFSSEPGKSQLTASLLRLLFPYILFVGLASVCMGILNSHRHFLAPALGPILFNISALIGLFVLAGMWMSNMPVWAYSTGVLAGGALQLLVQIPWLKARGIPFRPDFCWKDPALRRVLKLAFPALIGLMAAEVNILVDQLIASMLSEGSVAALSYGLRITQVPQGIFAIALATALLPTLSRQTAMGKPQEAIRTLNYSTAVLSGIMVPACLFLFFMAEPAVRVMFFRGEFSDTSLRLTAAALRYYALGMVFYAGMKITAPVFFALKDTKTPVKIAIGCMGLNIILNMGLTLLFLKTGIAEPLAGLALASSTASMANLLLLRRALRKRLGKARLPGVLWASLFLSGLTATVFLVTVKNFVFSYAASGMVPGAAALAVSGILTIILSTSVFLLTGGRDIRKTALRILKHGR